MIYYLPEPGCLFRIEPTRDCPLWVTRPGMHPHCRLKGFSGDPWPQVGLGLYYRDTLMAVPVEHRLHQP